MEPDHKEALQCTRQTDLSTDTAEEKGPRTGRALWTEAQSLSKEGKEREERAAGARCVHRREERVWGQVCSRDDKRNGRVEVKSTQKPTCRQLSRQRAVCVEVPLETQQLLSQKGT